jgi:capsular polysaccharide biosynthesis protein
MFQTSPFQTLLRRSKIIILVGLIFAVVSVLATVIFPLEYRADTQLLIISRSRYGVDPYTTIKSAERIGENLAQIVKTNDFYNKVILAPQYALDLKRFENVSERAKRKLWQKTVEASVVYGTGVLNISTYHSDKEQAGVFAGAVGEALVVYGAEYVGGDVAIKVLNQPIITSLPVRPNILANAVLGALVGMIFMSIMVLRKDKRTA